MAADLKMLGAGGVLRAPHLAALEYHTLLRLAKSHGLRKAPGDHLVRTLADERLAKVDDKDLKPVDLKAILAGAGVPRAEWSRLRVVASLRGVLLKYLMPQGPGAAAPAAGGRPAPAALRTVAVNADGSNRPPCVNDKDKLVSFLQGSVLEPDTDLFGVVELSGSDAERDLLRTTQGYAGHAHQLHYAADRSLVLWREDKLELADRADAGMDVRSRRNARLADEGSQKHVYAVLQERGGARRKLAVFGVHLPTPKTARRGQSDALRNLALDVEALQAAVDEVIVLGDFNMTPEAVREHLPDVCTRLAFDTGIENVGTTDSRFDRQRRSESIFTHEVISTRVHLPEA